MSLVSYPFAVSVIKVHESSLINRTEWNRFIEADLSDAYRLLAEMGYGQKASNPNDIDSLTRANIAEAKELVRELSPAPQLTDLLLLQTDAHNIKCVLKGMLVGEEVDDILLEGGSISKETLLSSFEKDRFEAFPKKMREAVEAFDPEMKPRELSALIDESVFSQADYVLEDESTWEKLKVSLSVRREFVKNLKRYFNAKADFTNVLTLLRVRRLGWDEKALEELLLEKGTILKNTFIKALSANEDTLIQLLNTGANGYVISNELREFVQDQNLSKLELRFFRKLFDIAHENYQDPMGLGPLINYIVQKEFEARALRRLFQAKRSGESITLDALGVS